MKKTTNVLAAVAAIGMFFTFAACSKTTDSASVGFKASRMATPLDLTKNANIEIQGLKAAMEMQAKAYPVGSEERKWLEEQVRALTAAVKITDKNYKFGGEAVGPSKVEGDQLLTSANVGNVPAHFQLPLDTKAKGMEGVTVKWTVVKGEHFGDAATEGSATISDKDKSDHKCDCTVKKSVKDNGNNAKFGLCAEISCGGYKCTVTCCAGDNAQEAEKGHFTIQKQV